MRALNSLILLLAIAAPTSAEQTGNWPHWRGPLATGVAPGANPPLVWGPEQNIRWKVALPGRGNGTPVVWGDRVFVTSAINTEVPATDLSVELPTTGGRMNLTGPTTIYDFKMFCLNRDSGELVWEQTACSVVPHGTLHPDNTYASASATTDGRRVYVSFGSQGIYCYDLEGNFQWSRNLGEMETRKGFGEGCSPVVYGNTLLVNWDHEGPSFLEALDAATGKTRWHVDRDEVTTWNTPLVVEAAERTQVIVNGTNRARSYDLATGNEIWACGGQVTNPIPSPVANGNLAICMTGYQGSEIYAIPLDATGDITDSDKIAWHSDEGAPYVPSPLLVDNRLYFTKGNSGILSCLDATTGEQVIEQVRVPGLGDVYASPVGAAGRVYLTGRNGTTVVIRQGDELEVLATNSLGEPVDASPAIVGDALLIRTADHLYCVAEEDRTR